jgi:hypothetical protein
VLQAEDSDKAVETLEKERKERQQLVLELKDIRNKLEAAKDVDPERYKQLIELEDKLEQQKAEAKGEYEKLLQLREAKWNKERADFEKRIADSDAYLENLLVGQIINEKLTGKVNPKQTKAIDAYLRSTMKPKVVVDGENRKIMGTLEGTQIELAVAMDTWLSGDEAKEFRLAEVNTGGANVGGRPLRPAQAGGQDATKLSPVERLKQARREASK